MSDANNVSQEGTNVSQERHVVSDMEFATTWTNTISNDGTVEQVAELLGLSRDYTQQRSVQLRKELRDHGVELPKVQNRRKKVKDTASVASAVADLLKQVDELDAAHYPIGGCDSGWFLIGSSRSHTIFLQRRNHGSFIFTYNR